MAQAMILRRSTKEALLNIIGSSTQPLGVENLIWIDTSITIGIVTVENTTPIDPAIGDVKIELGITSDVVMQTGRDSCIALLPLGIVYQYQNDIWVPLNAYAYLSGSWVKFSTDIPNGETTLPVNNTDTWLRCAGISPSVEGNPTLTQVAANSTLCAALMNNENAVNYMIRSATIQAAVLGSSVAISALDASSPYITPDMTANNQNGCATDNYQRVGQNQQWTQPVGTGSVLIIVPTAIWAYKVKWLAYSTYWNGEYPENNNCSIVFRGSNDGSNWTNLYVKSDSNGAYTVSSTATTAKFNYFQVAVTGSSIGASANNGQQLGLFKVWGKI